MTDPKIPEVPEVEVTLGILGVFVVRVVKDAYNKRFLHVSSRNGGIAVPDHIRAAVLERLILDSHPLYSNE